jgi:hypothetical protein
MASAASIARMILSQAVTTGGQTWTKISVATQIYARGYAQSLVDIAKGVADGDISVADGKLFARNSRFLFSQAVANMTQVALHQIQSFLDGVLGILKGGINDALGIALL